MPGSVLLQDDPEKRRRRKGLSMHASARFAIIGYGAITEEIVRPLAASGELRSLTGVLVRPARLASARERAAGRFPVTESIDALLAATPDCILECAGHDA